ncbi:MAG TPA: GTPase [Pirellulales bacterium]|nr:GTPase [Pirellulales bacterium]
MTSVVNPPERTTSATLLTPRGRGAVATIAVCGVDARTIVASRFVSATGRSLVDAPVDAILFGRWNGPAGEEVVACPTATDEIEIHCHGGLAAAEAILDSLRACGVSDLAADAWLARQGTGTLEVEALSQLPHARTLRTAAILHDQSCGAMRQAIQRILATLDYDPHLAMDDLSALVGRADLGRHLVEPFRVVIAGPPNVGKSSLMNAIVGYERAIVFDEPGTTRDAVTVVTALDGWPVELCDTAGVRATAEGIEWLGIERALERLTEADCRVLVFDRSLAWTDDDAALLASWPGAVVVHNKADLPTDAASRPAGLATSTVTGQGVQSLIATIIGCLVAETLEPGAAVPITPRQTAAIDVARDSLEHGRHEIARDALIALMS